MFCAQCGSNIPAGARFCGSCGAPSSAQGPVAAPPRPVPQPCRQCGNIVPAGKRFCSSCGTPVAALASGNAPTRPVDTGAALGYQRAGSPPPPGAGRTSQPVAQTLKGMAPLALAAAAGFGVAIVATFLDWITAGPFGASAWADHARYQIADAINVTSPIDAIVVLVIAGLGAFLLLGPAFGKSMPVPPWISIVVAAALAVLGIVEILYINSLNDKLKKLGAGGAYSTGFGLYLLIIAGAVAAVCTFVLARRAAQAGVGR